MKAVISIVLLIALAWIAFSFRDYAHKSMARPPSDSAPYAAGKLPGLPVALEPSLDVAKRDGPDGLKKWLGQHRSEIEDPRLTDIELDYVVLAGRSSPAEARRVLDAIKGHLAPGSPVYPRFTQLDQAYR